MPLSPRSARTASARQLAEQVGVLAASAASIRRAPPPGCAPSRAGRWILPARRLGAPARRPVAAAGFARGGAALPPASRRLGGGGGCGGAAGSGSRRRARCRRRQRRRGGGGGGRAGGGAGRGIGCSGGGSSFSTGAPPGLSLYSETFWSGTFMPPGWSGLTLVGRVVGADQRHARRRCARRRAGGMPGALDIGEPQPAGEHRHHRARSAAIAGSRRSRRAVSSSARSSPTRS